MKKVVLAVLLFITTSCVAQTSIKNNLPKCGRYNIIIANPCHWWLASKAYTIMGYVLIDGNDTSYYTLKGEEIDQSKVSVIRYCRLQRRHSKKH